MFFLSVPPDVVCMGIEACPSSPPDIIIQQQKGTAPTTNRPIKRQRSVFFGDLIAPIKPPITPTPVYTPASLLIDNAIDQLRTGTF